MVRENDKGYTIYFGDDVEGVVTAPHPGDDAVMDMIKDVARRHVTAYDELKWQLLFVPMVGGAYEIRAGHTDRKTEAPTPTGIYVQEALHGV